MGTAVRPPVAVTNTMPERLQLILRKPLRKVPPRLGLSILRSVDEGLLPRPVRSTPLTLLRTNMGPEEFVPVRSPTTWLGTVLTQAPWRLWTLVLLRMLLRDTCIHRCPRVPVTECFNEAPFIFGGLQR